MGEEGGSVVGSDAVEVMLAQEVFGYEGGIDLGVCSDHSFVGRGR